MTFLTDFFPRVNNKSKTVELQINLLQRWWKLRMFRQRLNFLSLFFSLSLSPPPSLPFLTLRPPSRWFSFIFLTLGISKCEKIGPSCAISNGSTQQSSKFDPFPTSMAQNGTQSPIRNERNLLFSDAASSQEITSNSQRSTAVQHRSIVQLSWNYAGSLSVNDDGWRPIWIIGWLDRH